MRTSRFIIIVSLCIAGIYGANCPDGFEGHHGTCYFFSHGKETWQGAYDSCKDIIGASLVEVTSDDENNYLSRKSAVLDHSFWIGLTDKMFEGEFVWETSTDLLSGTGYWGLNEPDSDPSNNCVRYGTSHQNLWSDSDCNDHYYYICEKSDGAMQVIG
ncbi:hypothetical protein ACF0H5_023240 [Mactra antiquata]